MFPVVVTQNRRKVLTNSILKCRERRLMLQGAKGRFFEQPFRIPQIQRAPLFFKLVKSSLHELFLCPGRKGRALLTSVNPLLPRSQKLHLHPGSQSTAVSKRVFSSPSLDETTPTANGFLSNYRVCSLNWQQTSVFSPDMDKRRENTKYQSPPWELWTLQDKMHSLESL